MPHQHTARETHAHRDDLTGEHALGDAGQLLLAVLFAAGGDFFKAVSN